MYNFKFYFINLIAIFILLNVLSSMSICMFSSRFLLPFPDIELSDSLNTLEKGERCLQAAWEN